jgi:TrmH RNA methyltransferase
LKDLLIYGRRAVHALWLKRPDSIIRAYTTKDRISWVGDLLKYCAREKKAYHIVTSDELQTITGSKHSEGVALLVRRKKPLLFEKITNWGENPLLFLDGVENPHNLGAITRTMAHFGAPYLLGVQGELPILSASWIRISEGGSEAVEPVYGVLGAGMLRSLKSQGFEVVALSGRGSKTLYDTELPKKTVFVLGHEIHGIKKEILDQATQVLRIPGTGVMESLNVGVAGALCLGEYYRRHRII